MPVFKNEDKLNTYLADIDRQAQERFDTLSSRATSSARINLFSISSVLS